MAESRTTDGKEAEAVSPRRIMPSEFMRQLRPQYYSDTEDRVTYVLEKATFDHRLETITSRNETHEFELFARKLCERAICPNLRPQTGPEGGGDSKADTETYPVADEVSRFYIGEANSGRERWGFAFSAKKNWTKKVRDDVLGLVGTGRSYDKIICLTSRYARSRDRARIEDDLSKKYGIPVIIHDRSWIIKEIIENDRKDLASNYLGVGEVKNDPSRLGPTDYSRAQQLDEIEKSLDDPAAFHGMERQCVSEALVAAKLSRSLERPRIETDGRFARAVRLADQDGSYRQKLESRYEHLWSAFWYFDDVKLVNDSYSAFESLALKSDHAIDLQLLCNLFQLLVNAVTHEHLSREESLYDERVATLRQALEAIAANRERPNNSLEAEVSLLVLRLNSALVEGKCDDLATVWRDYGSVLDRAAGLGEFKADRLVEMIEVAGSIAGNDASYNELVEKVAEFVSKRRGEAEGALILLKRAMQLDFSDRIDMIRLLGRAAYGLSKKEYTEHQIEALQRLMIAYRSAGLLWAARATCFMAAGSIIADSEDDSSVKVSFVPTMKAWAWIALGLRLIPDLLLAIQLLNGMRVALPLTEDSKARVYDDIRELEYALGCIVLNLDDAELRQLEELPDILEALGLIVARGALLYTLGYLGILREDGSIPKEETDEGARDLFSRLASQSLAQETRGPLVVHEKGRQKLAATILGMTVEIDFEGSDQLTVVAEVVLGSLEAFFATAIDDRVAPHTEKFRIELIEGAEGSNPEIKTNPLEMMATLTWPAALSLASRDAQPNIHRFLAEVSGHVLATTCVVHDIEALLRKLHDDDGVQHRMGMITAAPTSYHRVTSEYLSRLSDWRDVIRRQYPLQRPRPSLSIIKRDIPEGDDDIDEKFMSHRGLRVKSVIDVPAWDQAHWMGTLFVQIGPPRIPGIAFIFRSVVAARKIFERWRARFGSTDEHEEIHLAIIRHLPKQNPYHYVVLVTSKVSESDRQDRSKSTITANTSMTMTPDNPANLEKFLDAYREFGAFLVMPAVIENGVPRAMQELSILKRQIIVKDAVSVGEHDIEAMALRRTAMPVSADRETSS
jgi:hypothetical protein